MNERSLYKNNSPIGFIKVYYNKLSKIFPLQAKVYSTADVFEYYGHPKIASQYPGTGSGGYLHYFF